MSSILKALKKIEGRKVDKSPPAWPFGSGSLESMDHHIHRSRQRQKILGILITLCVVVLAVKLYIGSRPASEKTASTNTPPAATAQSNNSPEVMRTEPRISVAVKPKSVPEPEPSSPEPSSEATPPSTALSPPIEEASSKTAAPRTISPSRAEPSEAITEAEETVAEVEETFTEIEETATEAEAPPTTTTEIFGAPPGDDAGLSLMALVWSQQPESRFVVINGSIIREGGTIEESTVVRIEENFAVIRTEGVIWKLK